MFLGLGLLKARGSQTKIAVSRELIDGLEKLSSVG